MQIIEQLIWRQSRNLLGCQWSTQSSKCNPKMYPCLSRALVMELLERGFFRLGGFRYNPSLTSLFACFHGCSALCLVCQFVSYLATRGTVRIVIHNTQAKTKTNVPPRTEISEGEQAGCIIEEGESCISALDGHFRIQYSTSATCSSLNIL